MGTVKHSELSPSENHGVHSIEYNNKLEREADQSLTIKDIKKLALQNDDESLQILKSVNPVSQGAIGSAPPINGVIPFNDQKVVYDIEQNEQVIMSHGQDLSYRRNVLILEFFEGESDIDTSLDFDLSDITDFILPDADKFDFEDGKVQLGYQQLSIEPEPLRMKFQSGTETIMGQLSTLCKQGVNITDPRQGLYSGKHQIKFSCYHTYTYYVGVAICDRFTHEFATKKIFVMPVASSNQYANLLIDLDNLTMTHTFGTPPTPITLDPLGVDECYVICFQNVIAGYPNIRYISNDGAVINYNGYDFTPPLSIRHGFKSEEVSLTTSDTNQVKLTNVSKIESLSITDEQASSISTAKYLVSFDGRLTQDYWSVDHWETSTGDVDAQLKHQMVIGFVNMDTSNVDTIDFKIFLDTLNDDVTPTVDQITINLIRQGVYKNAPAGDYSIEMIGSTQTKFKKLSVGTIDHVRLNVSV